jgi:hypothetical protein
MDQIAAGIERICTDGGDMESLQRYRLDQFHADFLNNNNGQLTDSNEKTQ